MRPHLTLLVLSVLGLTTGLAGTASASEICKEIFKKANTPYASGAKTSIKMKTIQPRFQYFTHLSRSELGKMHTNQDHTGRSTVQGLTVSALADRLSANFMVIPYSSEYVCVWPSEVNAEFGYEKIDVYIARENLKGTCPYNVTLEHENDHVKTTVDVFNRYVNRISDSLRRATDSIYPAMVTAKDVNDASLQLMANIYKRDIVAMENERNHLNGQLDTPENYARTSAKCKKW